MSTCDIMTVSPKNYCSTEPLTSGSDMNTTIAVPRTFAVVFIWWIVGGHSVYNKLLQSSGFFTYHQVFNIKKIVHGARFALSVLYW